MKFKFTDYSKEDLWAFLKKRTKVLSQKNLPMEGTKKNTKMVQQKKCVLQNVKERFMILMDQKVK